MDKETFGKALLYNLNAMSTIIVRHGDAELACDLAKHIGRIEGEWNEHMRPTMEEYIDKMKRS